ncbi:MAG: HAMP domain-containing histidine kinase [Solirubrobacterales bacterium]|nr:HAMP domain-containing histidine kinase [Solirubrobacterales bacterium]
MAIFLVALVSYLVLRGQLRGQVDDALRGQSILVQHEGNFALGGRELPGLPQTAGGSAPFAQVVGGDGSVLLNRGGMQLPIDPVTRAVASGRLDSQFGDVNEGGSHLRVLTFHGAADAGGQVQPVAVQLARPLQSVDRVLSHFRLILLLLCAGGIALAAGLGRMAARRVLSPLAEVAQTAKYIGETDDLSHRIAIHADDEVGQLARRFNAMLDRLQGSRSELDESVRAQRQLVADASHELRTPVTSLRTNIEVLLAPHELSEEERRRLLGDVVEQSEELSALVGDLIELARGDLTPDAVEDVRLDRIAEEAVARARRNSPQVEFALDAAPLTVEGAPHRIARALNNLLENAARHSPPQGRVEVTVDRTGVRVRDHGTGVPEQDLPHVFDRFFRGANTRGQQGSGLGLAIVRQVAEQHGGSAEAHNAPEGGAVFSLRLVTSTTEDASAHQLEAETIATAKR